MSEHANQEKRQARLVFVDPEDDKLPYWWPALVDGFPFNILIHTQSRLSLRKN